MEKANNQYFIKEARNIYKLYKPSRGMQYARDNYKVIILDVIKFTFNLKICHY